MSTPAAPSVSLPFKLVVRVAVAFLELLESVIVVLANLGRRSRRLYKRHASYDLLKAHRLAAELRPGDVVLDVGCGTGHVLEELGYFVTLDRHGLELAPSEAPSGISVRAFDGHLIPRGGGSVDVVLFCYVLHHLTPAHARALVAEALRVARRKVILLEDSLPRREPFYRVRDRLHRMSKDLEYGLASGDFRPAGGESMFLTHEEWVRFLSAVAEEQGRPGPVRVSSLADLCKYRHHTLVVLEPRR